MPRTDITKYISISGRSIFAPGQAYTALSRAPSWDAVKIPCLNRNAFSVDAAVLREYERLEQKSTDYPLNSLHVNQSQ